jgi:hypothetical protein
MSDKHGDRKKTLKKIKSPSAYRGNSQVKLTSSYDVKIDDYPIFCFKHLTGGYSLSECGTEEKAHFVDKLLVMTHKTWNDLFTGYHVSGAGFELVPVSRFNTPMPSIVTRDVDKLYVMRFNSMNHRMIGIRSDNTFHITHIDIKLTAYQH